jgi:hypothetical protein
VGSHLAAVANTAACHLPAKLISADLGIVLIQLVELQVCARNWSGFAWRVPWVFMRTHVGTVRLPAVQLQHKPQEHTLPIL